MIVRDKQHGGHHIAARIRNASAAQRYFTDHCDVQLGCKEQCLWNGEILLALSMAQQQRRCPDHSADRHVCNGEACSLRAT